MILGKENVGREVHLRSGMASPGQKEAKAC